MIYFTDEEVSRIPGSQVELADGSIVRVPANADKYEDDDGRFVEFQWLDGESWCYANKLSSCVSTDSDIVRVIHAPEWYVAFGPTDYLITSRDLSLPTEMLKLLARMYPKVPVCIHKMGGV